MITMLFGEVRVTALASTPVLVLREAEGPRELAVWVSAGGAAAVLSGLEAESVDHPSTHDLLLEVLSSQSALIESVEVLAVRDGVYTAQITVNSMTIPCRVSDGVALALRSGAPILAAETLLAEHGLARFPSADSHGETDEVEQFREFLANVRADDFDERAP